MKKLLCCILLSLIIAGCGNEKVTDKQISVNLKSGTRQGLYTGEIDKDGKPVGKGVFKTQNSKGQKYTYTGGFKDNRFDGQAVLQFENGRRTETTYVDGAQSGRTKQYVNNILRFDGELKDGIANGNGTFYKQDGSVQYQGQIIDNLPSKPLVKLNESVSFVDWEYSVSNTKTLNTIGNTPPSGLFFAVFLKAKNNGNLPRHIGTDFFVLTDKHGRIYKPSTTAMVEYSSATNFDGNWIFTDINPGITVQNVPLIFDVPKDVQRLKLIPRQGIGKVSPILLQ